MTEPFVETETHRTKGRWVAKVFKEFGRQRTTIRALFYHALRRKESDYPICGYFVGEIRVTRPYHESDGERLSKWATKASELGLVPKDAFLDEIPGERLYLPDKLANCDVCRIELWLNMSAYDPIIRPICNTLGVPLISISGKPPSNETVRNLLERAIDCPTLVLCISDLSPEGVAFCSDLSQSIATSAENKETNVKLKRIALTPEQVVEMRIPMIAREKHEKDPNSSFQEYLNHYGLDWRKKAEVHAIEAYYPGGLIGFARDSILKYSYESKIKNEYWNLNQ